jgi:excisionase family DNA binding protein
MKAFLNASEVAKLLGVDRATISRWIKKGIVKGERPRGSRWWRISFAAYEELAKRNHEDH